MAEKNQLDELKNLSPQDRILKLKDINEKKKKEMDEQKKEIEQAQEMIKQSEGEIEEEDKIIRRIPIPQIKALDIDTLFGGPEAKAVFKTLRFYDERTEKWKKEQKEIAKQEAKPKEITKQEDNLTGKSLDESLSEMKFDTSNEQRTHAARQQYISHLAMQPLEQLYDRAMEIYSQSASAGYLNESQQQERYQQQYNLRSALDEKKKAMQDGRYAPEGMGEEISNMLDVASKVLGYRRKSM